MKKRNEKKKFRIIKKEIRILGVDDSPVPSHTKDEVLLVGTVFRAGSWLDGVLSTYIHGDGTDATNKITEMVKNSRNLGQLGVIMLDGITFGGFNLVNIRQIFESTGVPVIVIMRRTPNFDRIKKALQRFEDFEDRWSNVLEAGEVYKVNNSESVCMQIHGIEREDAEDIVKLSTTRSAIPEPLRVAHIIAAGIINGESKGRA
ncbi:DUF99 family protein [Methanobacterium spitsbergense]|uniref:UPF0215 protein K8N75_02730 n=1 Tax=Methanobacterium spitsbergense TaxID=2874285 RepID=A0A8T5UM54_9EURY|nr:DUF99 family protein [Methanobacterium spitsbergense]MBZ2164962.1 DUF99 family protein [Methanobacterium spitsbergense]